MLLQTCAAKGKGKQGMRQGMGSQKQGPQMPAPPAIDPENVEFVLFVRNPKVSTADMLSALHVQRGRGNIMMLVCCSYLSGCQ